MRTNDPNWTAPRTRQDWRDDDVLRVVEWLKSFVSAAEMTSRIDAARARLEAAQQRWATGEHAAVSNPQDAAAWYVLQGESFATDRRFWVPEDAARILPFLTRLGKELGQLRTIPGSAERAARLMNAEKAQPDSGIFELLVALAYRRRGWPRVEFVPEQPGIRRTHDLNVFRPRSCWAIECKRLAPSTYARKERDRGNMLAKPLHAAVRELGRSIVVEVAFRRELQAVPDDYLASTVVAAIGGRKIGHWEDEVSIGRFREIDWDLPQRVLSRDYVYYGSSRMIELLAGHYRHSADHSMAARWRPAHRHPAYADAVYQASVVSWWSLSDKAAAKKARHFRSILANAEDQLPDDRPGAIHIGVESWAGSRVDARRHIMNFIEARTFATRKARLRWVYANYFVPELTTDRNEAWALTETMAPYKIGSHSTRWPLPGHMLVSPESEGREGVHWDGAG